jgi:hypothetical protein
MSSSGSGIALLAASAGSVLATLAVLTVSARVRYARHLPFFRCRLGRPPGRRRRSRARWRRRRTWATWVGDVLMVRSGALRLWLTPVPVGIPREVTLEPLERGDVRGLGPRAVVLRFALRGGRELEIAVAAEHADELVGPFLTAALSGLPEGRRERGA